MLRYVHLENCTRRKNSVKIGAQFYTIRDFCKNTDDFAESLKKVADIGYTTVQISGTCDFEPMWLKTELERNGLECVLTHTPTEKLENQTVTVAKEHDIFNCKYVGLGYYGFNSDCKSDDFVKKYKPVAKTLQNCQKYFMYHNHDSEFIKEDGIVILEKLADAFSCEEMGFTLDTYWIQSGGADPAAWIEKFKGRVPCIHLKDYAYKGKMAVVGEGNINFDRVFEKAESSGTKYMLVEQDDCNGENPFDCLKRSYEYLHSLGFK